MKPLLAICIPTYNRDYLLDKMLEKLCPICQDLSIPIYISDNCSPDDTQLIISKYKGKYNVISYYQVENIGPDKNFEYLLRNVPAQYKWLLSDSSVILKDELAALKDTLSNNKYDFVVTGCKNRTECLPANKIYDDSNEVLRELGWHITLVSCLIYNDDIITGLNFERYYESYFLQTGILLEYIANKDKRFSCLFFNNLKLLGLNIPKPNHWMPYALEYFCKKWMVFVISLPLSYSFENKKHCIMSHGVESNLFSIWTLMWLRKNNFLNLSYYIKYKDFIPYTIKYRTFCLLLCFIPRLLLLILYKMYKYAASFNILFKKR